MLRQRVLTAVVLLPLVLGVVLFAPLWLFDFVVGAVLVLLAREYAALCGARGAGPVLVLAVPLLFAGTVIPWLWQAQLARWLPIITVMLWIAAPAWLFTRARLPGLVKLALGLVLLAGAGLALHQLKAVALDGRWVVAALVLVWAADVGGYFVGRAIGRHKLAPAVSPGKTWEGFGGGLALVLLVGGSAGYAFLEPRVLPEWIALLVLATVVSVVGDLVESLLKRQAGVKDSGTLLPGHGGVLDRLDSLLAVAPVFVIAGVEFGIFNELSAFHR